MSEAHDSWYTCPQRHFSASFRSSISFPKCAHVRTRWRERASASGGGGGTASPFERRAVAGIALPPPFFGGIEFVERSENSNYEVERRDVVAGWHSPRNRVSQKQSGGP